MKNIKSYKYILSLIFIFSSVCSVYAYSPIQNMSGLNKCYYKIDGNTYAGAVYSKGWNEIACNQTLDFAALPNSIGNIPDGTYYIYLKSDDSTSLGTDKSYSDSTNSSKSNKYGIQTFGPYKIDTRAPTCILKEIKFIAGKSNNQYYNNGKLFYKANSGAGEFDLIIESDDTSLGTNVSKIKNITFPKILGATPRIQSFTSNGKVLVTGKYSWLGNNNDTFNILNNNVDVCFDNAGNGSKLTKDSTTKVTFENGDIINSINSLTLTPDSSIPTISGLSYNSMNNGFKFKSGNDGNGSEMLVYDLNNSNTKYFAALSNRKIIIPNFQDNGSGLKSFNIKIEKSYDKNSFSGYLRNLSTSNSLITNITNSSINHDFSNIDLDINNGYRLYSWNIETLNLSGNSIETDKVCDMVGNCISTPTPDFRVVANSPILATNTALNSGINGIKHNLNSPYNGKVSNMYDYYTSIINFEDKYGNAIVAVSGVKELKLSSSFDNTMGCNQYNSVSTGDCIDFTFKNQIDNNLITGNTHNINTEKHIFNYIIKNYSQFKGILNIELKSAIPTKDEYFNNLNHKLYGDLTAKLQLKNLNIKINDTTSYGGIGENLNPLELASAGNQANYKWKPLINYNKVDNIYPLVEGQEKPLNIANIVNGTTYLNGYKLETKLGTNNMFLQFNNIYLQNGNVKNGGIIPEGHDTYDIIKNIYSSIYGYGYLPYSGSGNFIFTPKTVGGITNNNTNLAFYSKLNYRVNNFYTDIIIPSIQTGFSNYGIHTAADFSNSSLYNSNSNIIFAELDIRGISQTRNKTLGTSGGNGGVNTDNTFKDFSNITLFDIKTEIKKNVLNLLKGLDSSQGKVSGGYTLLNNLTTFPSDKGLNLQNGSVLYFKDTDVKIDCSGTCEINGKRTIIVENGNIFLNSDMKYANKDSIIGFILIGNTSNGNKSQFRIAEKITNGVGIIYSDGPIVSVKNDNSLVYDGTNISNTSLGNQLYWKGSFATRNTVGGAIKNNTGNCPYGTPEYQSTNCSVEKAQSYDLIYLRRYGRIDKSYYSVSNDPMGDSKVPLNLDKINIQTAGGDSYSKIVGGISNKTPGNLTKPSNYNPNSPLIIEYDSNLQTNPPIGFTK